jgi:hypothetical protein
LDEIIVHFAEHLCGTLGVRKLGRRVHCLATVTRLSTLHGPMSNVYCCLGVPKRVTLSIGMHMVSAHFDDEDVIKVVIPPYSIAIVDGSLVHSGAARPFGAPRTVAEVDDGKYYGLCRCFGYFVAHELDVAGIDENGEKVNSANFTFDLPNQRAAAGLRCAALSMFRAGTDADRFKLAKEYFAAFKSFHVVGDIMHTDSSNDADPKTSHKMGDVYGFDSDNELWTDDDYQCSD